MTRRRLALVSGQFVPSNLVGAQRARLWARYLPEFGWDPIVVSADPRHYEEKPDPDLLRLVDPGLRVIHAPTLPVKPVKIIGDLGLRAFWGCHRVVAGLARRREIDFVMITIPANFLAPVGRLVHRRYGVPYGIDYQDPWGNSWPGVEVPFSRAWASYRLAAVLEPWAVKEAALITGMAPGYVSGMLERNPGVAQRAVLSYMPMGTAPEDFDLVRSLHKKPFLFDPADGNFHMIYAGALLPAGLGVLDAFLAGVRALKEESPAVASRLRIHFVGTGSSADDPNGHRVLPRAREAGVDDVVSEHPARIGYVDALNHLEHASSVLVLGSTERHYTPSKVFQAILSGHPVFAMLHAESTAVDMVRKARAGLVLTLTEHELPAPRAVAAAILEMVEGRAPGATNVDRSGFDAYTSRESTRVLAAALDEACARASGRRT
jgi:hypothetical protein